MVGRPRTFASEMPLPGKKGGVPGIFHCLGQGDLRSPEIAFIFRWQVTVMSAPPAPCLSGGVPNPGGDTMIDRVFAGENTRPGGTADLAGGITTGELHSLAGNPVDVWTFIKSGPFIAQVAGSHIIHKDEKDIGFLRFRVEGAKCDQKEGKEEISVEFHHGDF